MAWRLTSHSNNGRRAHRGSTHAALARRPALVARHGGAATSWPTRYPPYSYTSACSATQQGSLVNLAATSLGHPWVKELSISMSEGGRHRARHGSQYRLELVVPRNPDFVGERRGARPVGLLDAESDAREARARSTISLADDFTFSTFSSCSACTRASSSAERSASSTSASCSAGERL
mmetsp:Transcript_630/g.2160  ORF Transcript_630/g.2160 Transcript_630/m.2160 type:complete len:178 (+) Transcript_630:133-666(+)